MSDEVELESYIHYLEENLFSLGALKMNDRFRRELQVIEEQGLTRKLRLFSTGNESEVVMNGKKFLLFSSNNYLGLATDSRLKRKQLKVLVNTVQGLEVLDLQLEISTFMNS